MREWSSLFTDIVGSTEKAVALGDAAWAELLERHHAAVRAEIARFGGEEMDTSGDGFFAIFREPGPAVACGLGIVEAVRPLGLTVRVGVHTGDCFVADGKCTGLAIHIGARIVALAAPGEVLVSGMTGGGPFRLQPGEWTDDTSMALCLAESLVDRGAFDPRDQMERYARWWREGHLASNGHCFDIGGTVGAALRRFEETGDPLAGSTNPESAANGSIMRLAPAPLAYAYDVVQAIEYSARSSRTTHAAARPVDACRYLGGLIAAAVRGAAKDELLDDGFWQWGELDPEIEEIARGSYKRKQPPEIRGSGFVVHTLEAALWALWSTDDFREGCLAVVNLGEDADTTGAVYGQLAGAIYGVDGIPLEWREKLALRETIESLADGLQEFSLAGAR